MTAAVLDRTRHEATAVWHLEHGRYLAVQDGGDTVVIADERSRNGVLVNGHRVQQASLRHGDQIRLGARTMRFLEV